VSLLSGTTAESGAALFRSLRLPGIGVLGLALLTLFGCSVTPPAPLPLVADDVLLQALAEQEQQYTSLRGIAKVGIENNSGALRSTQIVLAEKPDRFRAEILSTFGQPVVSMASDGAIMSVSIPSQRQFYQGVPSAESLARFTGIPLEVRDVVHLLLHQVPLIAYSQIRSEPGPSLILTDLAGSRQRLDFDHLLRLTGASYFDGGEHPWMLVRYTQFKEEKGFPHQLDLSLPREGVEARVELRELDINLALTDDKFHLLVPEGIPVQPLPR